MLYRVMCCLLVLLLMVSAIAAPGACAVVLNGQEITARTHAIVIPDTPSASETYAAGALAKELHLITGEQFPVVSEREVKGRIPLFVGKCAEIDVDYTGLGDDGIVVKTVGRGLAMTGNARGVVYAVLSFLQDDLGCRWLAEDCTIRPVTGRIVLPPIDRRFRPPFLQRDSIAFLPTDPDFAVRLRFNRDHVDTARGGRYPYHVAWHSFEQVITQRFAQSHPEYFAVRDGKRQYSHMPCMTNPDVVRLMTAAARGWIQPGDATQYITIVQPDESHFCECGDCQKVINEEGAPSGLLLRVLNAIADNIARDYPNVIIDGWAYAESRKPPRLTRPRPNVSILLCTYDYNLARPLSDSSNGEMLADLQGWAAITDRLFIWDYMVDFHHGLLPFPNLYAMGENIRLYAKLGVQGVYMQPFTPSRGGEFEALRRYLVSRLLWNPEESTDRIIDEFCAGYYGPAGRYVRQYISLLHASAIERHNLRLTIWTTPTAEYLTPEFLRDAAALFDRAEARVKDDPTYLRRVRAARLPVVYTQLCQNEAAPYRKARSRLVQDRRWDTEALARRFAETVKAEGITRVRESNAFADLPLIDPGEWLVWVTRWPVSSRIERIANPSMSVAVLPEMGGRIWRAQLRSGQDLLLVRGAEGGWQPWQGGYEEYARAAWRSIGWNEPYRVVARSRRSITLVADLANGLRVTRRIELDRTDPVLSIATTMQNRGDQPQQACIHVHPEFPMPLTERASLRVKRQDGTWGSLAIPYPVAPEAVNEREITLTGDDLPYGAWALADADSGLAIVNEFTPGTVATCYVNAHTVQARANLELIGKTRTLAPGESMRFEHRYRIMPAAAIPSRRELVISLPAAARS